MENKNQPAYPLDAATETGVHGIEYTGLTKRELIAAMAMQGILSNSADRGKEAVAAKSIEFADALLKQLG